MAADIIPLVEHFGAVPDFRQASGKRYALPAILALACAAMLCGYRSYGAIAEWGRNYGQHPQYPTRVDLRSTEADLAIRQM